MEEETEIRKAEDLINRRMREDDLFNSRTNVFLVTNGLLLAAVGLSQNLLIGSVLSILGLLVTIAWQICSWQSWKVIRSLSIEYKRNLESDYVEGIVQKALFKPGWKRPTDLIAKPLPCTFLIAWLVLLVINAIPYITLIL